jgi:hypothetical protein
MKWREFVEFAKSIPRERQTMFTRPMDDWPMTIALDHPGIEPIVFEAPTWMMNWSQAKHVYAEAMGDMARITKPTKIAFISSTWQVTVDIGAPDPELPPSRHPNRKEAVIVVVADAEIATAFNAPIRRRKYGPPLLGEWTESDEVSGPMMDPWRDALR